jgi:ketosteroid isomerase-like protein
MSVGIIRNVYESFARGDVASAFKDFHPQIEWREAENFPYADGNPYIGADCVLHGIFARIGADFEDFKVMPQDFVHDGNIVVTLGRYTGRVKATGKPVDARFAHVWKLDGNRITSFEQLTDTLQFGQVMKRE